MRVLFIRRRELLRKENDNCQRLYSVKELSWCSPGSHSPRNSPPKNRLLEQQQQQPLKPIDRFSIIAATSLPSRIIGIHGKQLPWKPLPEDRALFTSLTRDKLLILGRHTLEEQQNDLSHISHARHYIVVSRTLRDLNDYPRVNTKPHLARSFPEALGMAREIADQEQCASTLEAAASFCWVVGGERLYNEAVKHASAEAIHLSVVDSDQLLPDIDAATTVTRFPPNYWWDHMFRLTTSTRKDGFTYKIFRRHRGFAIAESGKR